MRLFSYIITHDSGFSPNPFWGYCTLANCKPAIRRSADIGDWIVGLTNKTKGNRIIYIMKVDQIISYSEYYIDNRFLTKIPNYENGKHIYKCGDNIYKPLQNGEYHQLLSFHSYGTKENLKTKRRDLSGKNVLISKLFYYFGSSSITLPSNLEILKTGRGHKCHFSQNIISEFLDYISHQSPGVQGCPSIWPGNDNSWKIG